MNQYTGSNFDDFLAEEGILDEATARAHKRLLALQVQDAMTETQVKAEIAEARREVRRYAARYGMSLARFEAEILAAADSFPAHEDYNDWFYLQSVLDAKQRDLADLQGLRRQ